MFELRAKASFAAGHHLRGYQGDCSQPHGHTWVVEANVRKEELNELGMAIDFRVLKGALRELLAKWDHRDLNSLPDFQSTNPTAENIARLAFERLSEKLPISEVTVWESPDTSVTYKRSGPPF